MSDNLELRLRKALDAEVEAILHGPSLGKLDPARLSQIRKAANASSLPRLEVPPLPDSDVDYRGMAARDGQEGGLSDALEKRIRDLEDQDDA